MTWSIYGNGDHLVQNLDVDRHFGGCEAPALYVAAQATSHDLSPVYCADEQGPGVSGWERDLDEVVNRLVQAECHLVIYPSESARGDLRARAEKEPEKEHVAINFHAADSERLQMRDVVYVSISLPPADFQAAWDLFETVLREPHLHYVVTVYFPGFLDENRARSNDTTSLEKEFHAGNPSSKEFLAGKTYFSHRVGISLRKTDPSEWSLPRE